LFCMHPFLRYGVYGRFYEDLGARFALPCKGAPRIEDPDFVARACIYPRYGPASSQSHERA
jgi:hypothetical protein